MLLPGPTVRVDEQQVILRKCGPKGGETTTAAESVEQGREARAEEEREWNEEYIPACCIDRPADREGCSNETPKAGQTLLSREEKLLDSRKAVPPNAPHQLQGAAWSGNPTLRRRVVPAHASTAGRALAAACAG